MGAGRLMVLTVSGAKWILPRREHSVCWAVARVVLRMHARKHASPRDNRCRRTLTACRHRRLACVLPEHDGVVSNEGLQRLSFPCRCQRERVSFSARRRDGDPLSELHTRRRRARDRPVDAQRINRVGTFDYSLGQG